MLKDTINVICLPPPEAGLGCRSRISTLLFFSVLYGSVLSSPPFTAEQYIVYNSVQMLVSH